MSKGLLTTDWHLTGSQPQERLDNYTETQYQKVVWIRDLCVKLGIDFVVHAGDLFDSAQVSHYVVQRYIELLKTFPTFFVTAGQHDMFFHSTDVSRSPLMVLHKAGAVVFINKGSSYVANDVRADFCGYGVDLPKSTDAQILVTHKMVINEKLWEGQKDATFAGSLLRRMPHKLILSGDNHQQFIHKLPNSSKCLINTGSLMRMTTAQLAHQPKVYVVDPQHNWYVKEYAIPIEPAKKVFNMEKLVTNAEHLEYIKKFADGLKNSKGMQGLDIEQNLRTYERKNKVDDDVVDMLTEVFASIKQGGVK